MNVSVLQKDLARGLSIVSRAVSRRSPLPILENILLSTEEGGLRLSATDLETSISLRIAAHVDTPGETTVPALTFTDLIKALDTNTVTLTGTNGSIEVRGGTSVTDVRTIPADEFPPLPSPDGDGLTVPRSDLLQAVGRVAFAAHRKDDRPALTGVLLETTEGQRSLTLAATDGYRLSVQTLVLAVPSSITRRAVVPARAMKELVYLPDSDDPIISLSPSKVFFHTPSTLLLAPLIDEKYPDVQQIIPRSFKTRVVVATSDFLNACKQAEIFAREGTLGAKISVSQGQMVVSGQADETGSSTYSMSASVEGPEIVFVINVRYLRDVLDVINTPNVALEITTDRAPVLLRAVGDEQFWHVIMPMALE